MNTLRRITNRLRDEWDYATPLARLAMVAAPLLLATTLLLAAGRHGLLRIYVLRRAG